MHPLRDGVVGEGDPAALADGELAQHRSRQSAAVEPSYVGPGDQAPWAADVLATLTRRTRRHPLDANQPMGSLQRGREVRPSTLLGNDLGLVDRVGLALVHDGGRPPWPTRS
jgi:hypothetical protein